MRTRDRIDAIRALALAHASALERLTPREQWLVRHCCGVAEGRGYDRNAVCRVLLISRERVRQMEVHVLRVLEAAAVAAVEVAMVT